MNKTVKQTIGIALIIGLSISGGILGYQIRQNTIKREIKQKVEDIDMQRREKVLKERLTSPEKMQLDFMRAGIAISLRTNKLKLDSLYKLGNNSSAYFSGEINFLEQQHNTLLRMSSYAKEYNQAILKGDKALMDKWALELNKQVKELTENENRYKSGKYKKR